MLIKFLAFASFREILGKERELVVNEGATVKEVLAILASSCTGFKVAAFEDSDELMDYVLLMINNKRIESPRDLSRSLHEGDELAIFPPVAGG